mmetsp:Transcript_22474/g.53044  ORF Transcript_22474/g.53044 Transcript_22474/m.53044 type:complete len:157 (+) Transcript_22474:35-505(+)
MTVIDDTVEIINEAKSRCGYEKCKNRRRNDDDDDNEKHSRELKRCSRCKSRWYCSINCQKADFPSHKKECRRIAAAASNVIISDEILGNKKSINNMWMNQQQKQYQVEEREEGKGRCLIATRTIHPKERIKPPNNACSPPDNDYWDPIVPPVLNED